MVEKKEKTEKKKSSAKKKKEFVIARGKRKTSVARVVIKPGSGRVRLNKILVDSINNKYVREIITEPLRYVGPEANSLDININASGGGVMGQAQAARTAIAKALVNYFKSEELKKKFESIDRSLIVEDPRRVEPKKFKGPKARARYQKSYR